MILITFYLRVKCFLLMYLYSFRRKMPQTRPFIWIKWFFLQSLLANKQCVGIYVVKRLAQNRHALQLLL